MCGRYQLDYGIDELMFMYNADNRYTEYEAKKEIFPTDLVAIITKESDRNFIDAAVWGLENHYDGRPLINARGETVDKKRTFSRMFERGRCIIPATAFFEWRKNFDGSKTKMLISVKGIELFGMAGLYQIGKNEKGNILNRCTIITTSANSAMADIHHRMPVILPSDASEAWLDNKINNIPMLKEFLTPYAGNIEITAAK